MAKVNNREMERIKRRVTVPVESIITYFEALPDPRHERNRLHLLVDVITIAVCGVIVGCGGPTAMAEWARAKRTWLKRFLELPSGIPSRDCIRRVLSSLKPEAFQECFQAWIAHLLAADEDGNPIIAIDGKTLRRSHDQKKGLGALHLVSAWASRSGLSLGQVATEEKSNEITAIPELLDRIEVKGAVVTIDAMGCQKNIFDEDQSRTRERHLANNIAWLRRFAVSLLKRHPAKGSSVGKSQIAGWNNDYLLEVLVKPRT